MPQAFYRIAETYLFDTCTQKCGYCILAENGAVLKASDLDAFRDPAHIDRLTIFFNKRTTETEKWHLMLTGGEPLLMPNFRRFCENLFEKGNRVSLYTALMVDAKQHAFQCLLAHKAPDFGYIMASFHPEAETQETAYWERVALLKQAGHNVIFRFVGHPARLHQLERLSDKCREMDVGFYPTTLFSKNYPHAYTDRERQTLASHFSSLSQAIQLAGGVDTTHSTCFAGSRILAVHLPSGEIWPCISVHKPLLGNIYEDRLALFNAPTGCPEAGIACICDIHFQQNIVVGTEDLDRFQRQEGGFVAPLSLSEQAELVHRRGLRFSQAPKGIGDVRDDEVLAFSKDYVKGQYRKNFGARAAAPTGPRPDIFVAALTPTADAAAPRPSAARGEAEEAPRPESAGSPRLVDALPPNGLPLWAPEFGGRRPEITEGFVMPGFAGLYWIWPEEYALLAKYVDLTRGDYLEIGSMCGIIAMSLAEKHPDRRFACVDNFSAGHGTIAGERETFLQNLREHGLKNVHLVEGDSLTVVPGLEGSFDVVFVDANHAYDYVLGDGLNAWRLLSPGGFIAFHDFDYVDETTRAVQEFIRRTGARIVEGASSLVVLSKASPGNDNRSPWEKWLEGADRLLAEQRAELARQESELAVLRQQHQELEDLWRRVESSAGWRVLNRWRRLRDGLAPEGTVRRRWYNWLLNSLRGSR